MSPEMARGLQMSPLVSSGLWQGCLTSLQSSMTVSRQMLGHRGPAWGRTPGEEHGRRRSSLLTLEEYLAFRTGEEDRGSGTVAVGGGAAGGRCQSLEASRAATTSWSAGGPGGRLGGGGAGAGGGQVTLAIGQLDTIPGGEQREGDAPHIAKGLVSFKF